MGSVNWADLQKAAGEAAFEALPAGSYDVVVDTAEAAKTSTDKDMIKVRFKVEGGPYAGKVVFNQFVISTDNPNALAFFFRHMAALGLGDGFFAANPRTEQVAATLVGRRCQVKLSQREWPKDSGQLRNNVDSVSPPPGGQQDSPAAAAPGGLPGLSGATPTVAPPSPVVAPGPGGGTPPVFAPPAAAVPPPPVAAPPPVADQVPPPPALEDLPF